MSDSETGRRTGFRAAKMAPVLLFAFPARDKNQPAKPRDRHSHTAAESLPTMNAQNLNATQTRDAESAPADDVSRTAFNVGDDAAEASKIEATATDADPP